MIQSVSQMGVGLPSNNLVSVLNSSFTSTSSQQPFWIIVIIMILSSTFLFLYPFSTFFFLLCCSLFFITLPKFSCNHSPLFSLFSLQPFKQKSLKLSSLFKVNIRNTFAIDALIAIISLSAQ